MSLFHASSASSERPFLLSLSKNLFLTCVLTVLLLCCLFNECESRTDLLIAVLFVEDHGRCFADGCFSHAYPVVGIFLSRSHRAFIVLMNGTGRSAGSDIVCHFQVLSL